MLTANLQLFLDFVVLANKGLKVYVIVLTGVVTKRLTIFERKQPTKRALTFNVCYILHSVSLIL